MRTRGQSLSSSQSRGSPKPVQGTLLPWYERAAFVRGGRGPERAETSSVLQAQDKDASVRHHAALGRAKVRPHDPAIGGK